MNKSVNKIMAVLAAMIFFGWNNPLLAETSISEPDREKVLEKRINYLEERLRRLEKLLSAVPPAKSSPPAKVATRATVTPTSGKLSDVPETAPRQQTASEDKASAPSSQTSVDPPPPGVGAADDAPQELNVLRENAVTLKPAGVEISNETDYIQRQSTFQRDRAVVSTTAVRYGVLNWLELSANVPIGYSTRVSNTSPVSAATAHVSGIGDLTLQANARVMDQTPDWPGVVVSLGVIVPTGANPYDFSHYGVTGGISNPNPRNPLADYFSQGAWGLHTNLQLYKTLDPVILFLGFGADRIFPQSVSGYTVNGYTRLSYNLGFSFALSEKTTLGFSLNGSYSPDLQVNGRGVFQTASEPTLARLTVIQRLRKDVYLEPSISFGLDQDSPDFILGVGIRARF